LAEDLLWLARHGPPLADAVLADYVFTNEAIAYALRPRAPSAVVMHDVFSSRTAQFQAMGESDSVATLAPDREAEMLGLAGIIVAIQAAETQWVAQRLPHRQVVTALMATTPVPAPRPGKGAGLLFVGTDTAPNIQGLAWFLAECWPSIRAANPDAMLRVAGSVCRSCPGAEGLRLLGVVPDLAPVYEEAAVVISPLRAGSGLKIKLIEALGQGKAMVATSVTMQGVEEMAGSAVDVADAPAAFVAAVLALLADPALRAARGGEALRVARDYFGPEACYGAFAEALLAGIAQRGEGIAPRGPAVITDSLLATGSRAPAIPSGAPP
jgi:succinoglycan biosynthesis protein ExoO